VSELTCASTIVRYVIERHLVIETPEGSMGTYVVHPQGVGPFPVVLFLMDAPGKRPLLHEMAKRIAESGYYVMLPNLYYRTTPSFELDFSSKESFQRMVELMGGTGNRMIARDASELFAYAEKESVANAQIAGCVGYCMSGPFALYVAAEHQDRVRAAASFYGVRLITDSSDSPHAQLANITGEIYVGCAEHDDYVPLTMVDDFETAMVDSGVHGKLERYWGNHHGFAFNDRPAYDAVADQRHWEVLLDLFARNLNPSDELG